MVCMPNAFVIRILELKLDNYICNSKIEINHYNILRSDRNSHEGGVACYARNV